MHAFRGRSGRRIVWVSVVVLLFVVSSILAVAVQPIDRSSPSGSGSARGAQNLVLAEQSLALGAGPAQGQPLSCQLVGVGSARCGSSDFSPAAAETGNYEWSNLSSLVGTSPSPRFTNMAWDASDGYVLLYGGDGATGAALQDTWTYANGTWTNITSITHGAPPAVFAAGMAYDPSSGKVVLFGGLTVLTSTIVGYTWTYHDLTWTNLTPTLSEAPVARLIPAMSTDTTNSEIVLFGGSPGIGYFDDTWVFKNGVWTNITSSQPIHMPGLLFPLLSDYPGHGAFLTGTWNISGSFGTFSYVFSGGTWTNISSGLVNSPPCFYLGYSAYLPAISGILEFTDAIYTAQGGLVFSPTAWLFTGAYWTNVTTLIGTTRDAFAAQFGSAAYDAYDQAIITFGGLRLGLPEFNGYTWALSAPPAVTAHVTRSVTDVGQPVTFSSTVSEGLAINKVAWKLGDGGTSSNRSQTHTYTATGFYTATVTATSITGANSSAAVSLQVNPAPAVALSATPNATAGSPVGLAATVNGGTGPYTYSWTLGDKNTSTAAFVSHVYAAAGTYTVNVTVTDAVGATAHASLPLTVAAASSSSSGGGSLTSGTGLYLLLGILVLLIVVVLLAVLLVRKPKSPSAAPAPYSGPTYAPPPGAAGPPPPPGAG
jgi:PKD repeat protein